MGRDAINWCDRCGEQITGHLTGFWRIEADCQTDPAHTYTLCESCVIAVTAQMKHRDTRIARMAEKESA